MLRRVPTTLALFVVTATLGVPAPGVGLAQDLPDWAEPVSPPPIEKRSPQAQPSGEKPGANRNLRSPPSPRGENLSHRADPTKMRRSSPPQECNSSDDCDPGEVCCAIGGGGKTECRSTCRGGQEEVPLSPTGALLLSLFGAGYGAYRLREGSPEAAQ